MAQSSDLSTSNSNIKYRITVTETSSSRLTNTSTVHIQVDAWKTLLDDNNDDFDGECYVKVDGYQQTTAIWSAGSKPIGYNSHTIIYEQDLVVAHNFDGSKTIQVAASFELYYLGAVRLSTGFQGFDVELTTLDVANSELISVNNMVADATTPRIVAYARVYNTYLHTLTIKNADTTVLTIPNLELVDGENTITLTAEQKSTLTTYMSNTGLSAFTATFILATYDGSTQIGSSSTAYAIVRTTPGSGNPLVSFRQAGVGIKNNDPQYPLDVNGTVNCTMLQQSTPSMEVVGTTLKILRW